MKRIVLVGEDRLSCSLGRRLVEHWLPEWQLLCEPIDTKGVTKLRAALPRYQQVARQQPVLCIADTDGVCARDLLGEWLPDGPSLGFHLRLAVSEAEVWALADRSGFAKVFGISEALVSRAPESLADPKREVLKLAARSSKRVIKEEVPSAFDSSKPGTGYNTHLCAFVNGAWNPERAAEHSDSLMRAQRALQRLSRGA
jgi:hypothetical protein